MAVKLRLMRVGKRNRPAYRICAIEKSHQRDGAFLENIGFYDPYIADDSKKVRLKKDRAEYWLSVGALPSFTVLSFLRDVKVDGLIRSKSKPKRRRNKPTANPAAAKKKKARRVARKARAAAAEAAKSQGESKDES